MSDVSITNKLLKMELTNLRKSKNITQKELSKISGLSESCISSIENDAADEKSPTVKSVLKYLSALGGELYIKS